jgi:hypothetical protein
MSDEREADYNRRQLVYIPGLTQHEFNLIQYAMGDMMRNINHKKGSFSRFGFRYTDCVGLLRKMGVTADLSPEGMESKKMMSSLNKVLKVICMKCGHSRTGHAVSSTAVIMDPNMADLDTFTKETPDTYCLMPFCKCKMFQS